MCLCVLLLDSISFPPKNLGQTHQNTRARVSSLKSTYLGLGDDAQSPKTGKSSCISSSRASESCNFAAVVACWYSRELLCVVSP